MRSLIFKTAAVGLLLSTLTASAVPVGGTGTYYTATQTSGYYSARVNFQGNSSPVVTSDMTNAGAPITAFVNALNAGYQQLPIDMKNALSGYAASRGVTLTSLTQSGDISVGIVGNADGTATMTLSGLRYDFSVSGSQTQYGVTISCTSNATILDAVVTTTYNPFSGALTNSRVSYTPVQSTNCDNSLSWVPFLGDFINNKADNYMGNLVQNLLNSYSNKVIDLNPTVAIFGFTNSIQRWMYMVGNVDAGMYVKNNLPNLIQHSTISVYAMAPNKYFPAGKYKTPGPSTTTFPAFGVTFTNGSSTISFTVSATGFYTWEQTNANGT